MKTKLSLTRFAGTFGTLRFDEKSFFNTFLGFTPHWDYKHTNAIHADSPGVYTIEKISKLSTVHRIRLKCDFVDCSVVNGKLEPILSGFF